MAAWAHLYRKMVLLLFFLLLKIKLNWSSIQKRIFKKQQEARSKKLEGMKQARDRSDRDWLFLPECASLSNLLHSTFYGLLTENCGYKKAILWIVFFFNNIFLTIDISQSDASCQ